MSEPRSRLPDEPRQTSPSSVGEQDTSSGPTPTSEREVPSHGERPAAGTPFETFEIDLPPTGSAHPFVTFSRLAGFAILTCFGTQSDRQFLLRIARKMGIPPDDADAVIKFIHWSNVPPPGEPQNRTEMFRVITQHAVDNLREGDTRGGEIEGGSHSVVQGVYRRWSGTDPEVSIPLEVFSGNQLDEETW